MVQRSSDPVDTGRVWSLSRSWGADAVISRAISVAWKTFELEETDLSRWADSYVPSTADRRALRTYLDPEMGFAARSFASLRVLPGPVSKARFAYALAFPDRDYSAGRHASRIRPVVGRGPSVVEDATMRGVRS